MSSGGERIVVPAAARIHLEALTGLRFFAAIVVVLDHLTRDIAPLPVVSDVFVIGNVGVSFFFVLSGFVLAWTHRDGASSTTFYRNRVARVYPLHLLTLATAGAAVIVTGGRIDPIAIPLSVLLLQAWVPKESIYFGVNGPSWSLSCEAFFYALFPAMIRPFSRAARPVLLRIMGLCLIAAAIVSIIGHVLLRGPFSVGIFYVNPAYRVWEFIIGLCLAMLIKKGLRVQLSARRAGGITVAAYAAVAIVNAAITHRLVRVPIVALPSDVASLLMTPVFALLITAVVCAELRGARLVVAGRGFVRLGRWSFALYVVHSTILIVVQAVIPGSLEIGPRIAIGLGTVALAIGASGLLYRFVEVPVQTHLRARSSSGPRATEQAVAGRTPPN